MIELEFNLDNTKIGYRLQYLELLNWGTFTNDIWRIEPNGNNALLTGAIGSGKSTVVDAITTLLVPQQGITYNKAANAESKERNLLSYIKGYYKQEQNEAGTKGKPISHRYKDKNDSTFTVIIGNFYNAGYNSHITLAQVFWIKDETVHKLLIIGQIPLTIKEYFSNIEDISDLRKNLDNNKIQLFGDNFKEYSIAFRQHFGMQNQNAIELFYQTVSMKSVKDLSSFVREQMLEKTDVKEQLEILIKQFNDLTQAHNAVVKARKQKAILEPIVSLSKSYREAEEKIIEIQNTIDAIPSFLSKKKIELLEQEIAICQDKLIQINNHLEKINKDIDEIREQESKTQRAIDDNGGKRLAEIDSVIKQLENSKTNKEKKHTTYSKPLSDCSIAIPKTDKSFYGNIQVINKKQSETKEWQNLLSEEKGRISASKSDYVKKITENEEELKSLKNRQSNIDYKYLKVRQELIDDLNLNEEDIPFVGELLKVSDSEKEWEGAIERLLRTFAISLVVPQRLYSEVSQYINKKHIGIKLEYYNVPKVASYKPIELAHDSVVEKIDIKHETEFEDWLQNELGRRFNLQCVSINDYQKLENVITKEGQYKIGKQRNIKDDRRALNDRRFYVLGWSNKEKIGAIELEIANLRKKKEELQQQLEDLKKHVDDADNLIKSLNQLETFTNWYEVNFTDDILEIEKLKKEKAEIENSNNILKTLQGQLEQIKNHLREQNKLRDDKIGERTSVKDKEEQYADDIINCKATINTLLTEEQEIFFPILEKLYANINFTIRNIDSEQGKQIKLKNEEKDKLRKEQQKHSNAIISSMQAFNKEYVAESVDLKAEIDTRNEYLALYEKIANEGLPKHETKFKEELKEKTINNLVSFQNYLDEKFKAVAAKIKIINEHLYNIEYNNGTYIELLATPAEDEDIREFKNDLKSCFSNIAGISDAYTEERFNQVKALLDKFKSNETAFINWTNKVTDVRNWRIFNASEKFRADDTEKEFYASSAGKSGGQKEKLAYTVLASALAYQFGLTHNSPKSKSYRFVVIDEAFGRGDDESTQFGLKLFEKLHLQLLVITPMQKISIIENYVNSVHHVSKNDKDISQIQNLTIEEYKKKKESHLNKLFQVQVTDITEEVV